MDRLVAAGEVPGLLAYVDGRPAGWVSVGPRDHFGRVEARGETGCWLIACLYIDAAARQPGMTKSLLAAAAQYALDHGAITLEAIPMGWRASGVDGATQLAGMFLAEGFQAVDRLTEGISFRKELSATP